MEIVTKNVHLKESVIEIDKSQIMIMKSAFDDNGDVSISVYRLRGCFKSISESIHHISETLYQTEIMHKEKTKV